MSQPPFISRGERLATVGSTNDIVRDWLDAGTPEVCLAVADEQTAGRGRAGRTWQAPPGAALLLSLGFRPTWLAPDRAWRLAATVSVSMAEAAEQVAGLPAGTIRLKWPNDLVTESAQSVRKLAGVLGESQGLGSDDPRVVVGIGLNAGWRAADFPPELAPSMTSLHEVAGGGPIDRDGLLDRFLDRLEPRVVALRDGRFDAADWQARQATTGRDVDIETPDGAVERTQALDVDPATGGLIVAGGRVVLVGEIRHLRLAATATASV